MFPSLTVAYMENVLYQLGYCHLRSIVQGWEIRVGTKSIHIACFFHTYFCIVLAATFRKHKISITDGKDELCELQRFIEMSTWGKARIRNADVKKILYRTYKKVNLCVIVQWFISEGSYGVGPKALGEISACKVCVTKSLSEVFLLLSLTCPFPLPLSCFNHTNHFPC